MKRSALISMLILGACIFSWIVSFQHGNHRSRCSLDGSEIQPLYEVIIVQKNRLSISFAGLLSARIWLRENSEHASSILVTDETTGGKIRAEDAFYVLSEVVTTPYTGNKIHVFAKKTRARSHATQFKGKLVKNPFQAEERKPVLLAEQRIDPRSGTGFLFPSSQNPLSLPARIALMNKRDSSYLPQEHPARFPVGHSTPPDKPPRIPA